MADGSPQTFKNHARFDPKFHFFLAPLALALFVSGAWHAFRFPTFATIWSACAAFLFFVAVFLIRVYSLKVQDRVIRLEERLRLSSLLPESEFPLIAELTEGQLIALRFASDAELPALAGKAAAERLAPKDIKKLIQSWRADYFRV